MAKFAGRRFKIRVDQIDKKMNNKAKVRLIEQIDLHALEPLNVSLRNAEVTFYLVCDAARDVLYFGRLIAKTRISRTKQYF